MADDPWARFKAYQPEPPAADPWARFKPYEASPPSAAPVSPSQAPMTAPAAPVERSLVDRMFPPYGVAASIANGMTFGTLPNIQAGIAAGVEGAKDALGYGDGRSMGQVYDDTLKRQQDARRGYAKEHPILNAAGDIAGGVTTGLGLARNGVTLVGREAMPVLGNMTGTGIGQTAKRMAAGAVEGAAYAGAAGFGGGEGGFENRAAAAAKAAPAGAVLGAAIPGVIDAGSAVYRTARNLWNGVRNPEQRATDWLVERMAQDRRGPNDLAAAIEAARGQGQPGFTALDAAGRNTQKLAKAATRAPGQFRNDAFERLHARQDEQAGRLGQFVDDALGVRGADAYATEQGLLASRRTAAAPLYDRAYAASAPRGDFYDEMLGRQSVQDALGTVRRTAREQQIPLSDVLIDVPNPNARTVTTQVPTNVLGSDGRPMMQTVTNVENPTISVPTVRGWDMVKRALDAQVNAGFASTDSAQRSLAAAVRETRNQLRDRLGQDVPDYGLALQRYADDTSALEAIEAGRGLAAARNPDEATAAFRGLTPGQQSLARTGAAREIGVGLDRRAPGDDKARVFTTPSMTQRLDTLSSDPIARGVFADRIGRERQMASTRRLMTGGSDTAENLGELQASIGALASALRGNFGTAAARAIDMAGGMSEPAAMRIGNYLMSSDPAAIRSIAPMFVQAEAAGRAPAIPTAATISGIASLFQIPGRQPDARR